MCIKKKSTWLCCYSQCQTVVSMGVVDELDAWTETKNMQNFWLFKKQQQKNKTFYNLGLCKKLIIHRCSKFILLVNSIIFFMAF